MRKTILLLGIVCAINVAQGDVLKVMTYNLMGMKPGTEPEVRILHIIDNLIEIDPDIIGLQEVCESINGGGADNQAKVIADSLSAYFKIPYYVYTIYTHLAWYNQFREYIGIVTKYPVEDEGSLLLAISDFPRRVMWNKINTPLGIVNFFNTHLSFNNNDVQIQQIIAYIESIEQSHPSIAVILTGDMNATPNTASIQQLTDTGTDSFYIMTYPEVNPGSPGYTSPSNAPTSKIDYIFLKNTSSLMPYESEIVMDQPYSGGNFCSDHLGLLTSFEMVGVNIEGEPSVYPEEYQLFQNYPNPFNTVTTVKYRLSQPMDVSLKIYNLSGQEIVTLVDTYQTAREYQVKWESEGMPSGLYFCRLKAGNFSEMKKLILQK